MNRPTIKKVKIVLTRSVHGCGACNAVTDVRPGYARYLITEKKFAEFATPKKLEEIKSRAAELQAKDLEYNKQAEKNVEILSAVELNFIRKASDQGRLFGSISTTDFVEEVFKVCNIQIPKSQINLPVIKQSGNYDVIVNLTHTVTARVKIFVGASAPNK